MTEITSNPRNLTFRCYRLIMFRATRILRDIALRFAPGVYIQKPMAKKIVRRDINAFVMEEQLESQGIVEIVVRLANLYTG